jgi:hypothetical protein
MFGLENIGKELEENQKSVGWALPIMCKTTFCFRYVSNILGYGLGIGKWDMAIIH